MDQNFQKLGSGYYDPNTKQYIPSYQEYIPYIPSYQEYIRSGQTGQISTYGGGGLQGWKEHLTPGRITVITFLVLATLTLLGIGLVHSLGPQRVFSSETVMGMLMAAGFLGLCLADYLSWLPTDEAKKEVVDKKALVDVNTSMLGSDSSMQQTEKIQNLQGAAFGSPNRGMPAVDGSLFLSIDTLGVNTPEIPNDQTNLVRTTAQTEGYIAFSSGNPQCFSSPLSNSYEYPFLLNSDDFVNTEGIPLFPGLKFKLPFLYAEGAYQCMKCFMGTYRLAQNGWIDMKVVKNELLRLHNIFKKLRPSLARALGNDRNTPLHDIQSSEQEKNTLPQLLEDLMAGVLASKFSVPALCNILLNTGSAYLMMYSPNRDWGTGKGGDGKNTLGVLLMWLRQNIAEKKGLATYPTESVQEGLNKYFPNCQNQKYVQGFMAL